MPREVLCQYSGIIPAYAGSTRLRSTALRVVVGSSPHTRGARTPSARAPTRIRDHPRIRGEHPSHAAMDSTSSLGSSPHTRGAPNGCMNVASISRDHPRIRGEHTERLQARAHDQRIIPAYAGSTLSHVERKTASEGSSPHTRGAPGKMSLGMRTSWDHPRIRGEHEVQVSSHAVVKGIIPAYAGST